VPELLQTASCSGTASGTILAGVVPTTADYHRQPTLSRRGSQFVVALDGRQHTRPAQAARDDDRGLYLRCHGYTIRRYGNMQLTQQPEVVIEDLLAAFAEANPLGLNRAA
jgi:Protein of unknown function (DUF559)